MCRPDYFSEEARSTTAALAGWLEKNEHVYRPYSDRELPPCTYCDLTFASRGGKPLLGDIFLPDLPTRSEGELSSASTPSQSSSGTGLDGMLDEN